MKVKMEKGSVKEKGRNKIWFIGSLIVSLGVLFVGWQTFMHGREVCYESPYELADDFVTYTYKGDTESIFKMQAKLFQERSIQDNQNTCGIPEDDVKSAIANLKRPLKEYIETLASQHGTWTETHKVNNDMYVYTEEDLADLRQALKYQGIDPDYLNEITKAGIVDVDVDLKASNGSGGYPHTVHVPVYKHGDYWYLGQRTGTTFLSKIEGEHDPYGDLLDGFSITGNWDAQGNEIVENAEGNRVFTDADTGREYYEDIYGNRHYYDKDGHEGNNVVEVTGPDGGEALTDTTWKEYWDTYYEEQGMDIYPNFQYDEFGNIQYLDENGNVTLTVGPDGGEPLTQETTTECDEWGNTLYLDKDGNVIKKAGPDGGEPLTEETYQKYWEEQDKASE